MKQLVKSRSTDKTFNKKCDEDNVEGEIFRMLRNVQNEKLVDRHAVVQLAQ